MHSHLHAMAATLACRSLSVLGDKFSILCLDCAALGYLVRTHSTFRLVYNALGCVLYSALQCLTDKTRQNVCDATQVVRLHVEHDDI